MSEERISWFPVLSEDELEEPERKLFAGQVRYSAAHFRLVRASELPEAVATRGPADRFPLAITFDDDLACHRATSMAILAASDAPGTFFVSGASLSTPAWFWWEVLDAHDPDPHLARSPKVVTGKRSPPRATRALLFPGASGLSW